MGTAAEHQLQGMSQSANNGSADVLATTASGPHLRQGDVKRKGADLLVAPLKLNVRLSKCGPLADLCSTCGAILLEGTLLDLTGFRSYDPIRCQEPQWPRRPLAIGRRGLPLNPSRSAPGMSSTPSAQSHIRGYRSGGPHSIPSAGFPKSVEAHAEGSARTAK